MVMAGMKPGMFSCFTVRTLSASSLASTCPLSLYCLVWDWHPDAIISRTVRPATVHCFTARLPLLIFFKIPKRREFRTARRRSCRDRLRLPVPHQPATEARSENHGQPRNPGRPPARSGAWIDQHLATILLHVYTQNFAVASAFANPFGDFESHLECDLALMDRYGLGEMTQIVDRRGVKEREQADKGFVGAEVDDL